MVTSGARRASAIKQIDKQFRRRLIPTREKKCCYRHFDSAAVTGGCNGAD